MGLIFFLIFRKTKSFAPNRDMDPKFSRRLSDKRRKLIKVFAVQISFNGKTVYYEGKIYKISSMLAFRTENNED